MVVASPALKPAPCPAALAAKIAYYGPSFAPDILASAGISPADFEGPISARMLALGIAGDAATVVERCRGLVALGARHISFGPPLGPDPQAALEVLGREVLPALRG